MRESFVLTHHFPGYFLPPERMEEMCSSLLLVQKIHLPLKNTLCMLEDIIYTLKFYVIVIMFVYAQFDFVNVSRKCQYMHEIK